MLKYIIYDNDIGYNRIVIFDGGENHKSMANRLKVIKIKSAGQIVCDSDLKCIGESLTLEVKSRKDYDSKIIKIWLEA